MDVRTSRNAGGQENTAEGRQKIARASKKARAKTFTFSLTREQKLSVSH